MSFNSFKSKIETISKKIKPNDPRFENSVVMSYRDGTFMHIKNAFLVLMWHNFSDPYNIVFTKNHGLYISHRDNCSVIMYGEDIEEDEIAAGLDDWDEKDILVGDVYN